jgi:hypothetical protein
MVGLDAEGGWLVRAIEEEGRIQTWVRSGTDDETPDRFGREISATLTQTLDAPLSHVAVGRRESDRASQLEARLEAEFVALAEARQAAADEARRADDEARRADDAAVVARDERRLLVGELAEARGTLARLQVERDEAVAELEETQSMLLGSWGVIQDMRRSRSWKATEPLRRAKAAVRRR